MVSGLVSVAAAIVGELAVGEWVALMATGRAGRSVAAPGVVVRPTVERPPAGGAGRVGGELDPPAGPRSGPSASGAAGRMPAKTAARGPVHRPAGGRTGGTGAGCLRRAGGAGRVSTPDRRAGRPSQLCRRKAHSSTTRPTPMTEAPKPINAALTRGSIGLELAGGGGF